MWHSKTFPHQSVLPAELLRAEFRKLAAADGADVNRLGVFVFYPPGSPTVTLYFPPETATLAALVGAEPCARPALKPGMGLYLGEGTPTQAHFPESFPAPPPRAR